MKYIKSFLAVVLTIASMSVLWFFIIPDGEIPWYAPIISVVILVAADAMKPPQHPLTVGLMFIAATFYIVVDIFLLFYFKTSITAALILAIAIVLIVHTHLIEKKILKEE